MAQAPSRVTGHLKPWTPQDHGQHSLGGSVTGRGRSAVLHPGSSGPDPGPKLSLAWMDVRGKDAKGRWARPPTHRERSDLWTHEHLQLEDGVASQAGDADRAGGQGGAT